MPAWVFSWPTWLEPHELPDGNLRRFWRVSQGRVAARRRLQDDDSWRGHGDRRPIAPQVARPQDSLSHRIWAGPGLLDGGAGAARPASSATGGMGGPRFGGGGGPWAHLLA